jgi:hypothetical protein
VRETSCKKIVRKNIGRKLATSAIAENIEGRRKTAHGSTIEKNWDL